MSQGSVDLQGLRVTNGMRYNVGASGAPLVIAVSSAATATPFATFAQSEGTFYWSAGTNNVESPPTQKRVVGISSLPF